MQTKRRAETGRRKQPTSARQNTNKQETVRGPGKVPVKLTVNGIEYNVEIEPRRTLLDVIRNDLHLTGTKEACNMGECGACTVILNGKAVYSCLVLAIECEGDSILTVEGIAQGDKPDPLQKAFIEHDAFQCGFCTPGQIMTARALLDANPNPTREEIRQAMAGNICRCGAYLRIIEAVEAAAREYSRRRSRK